MDLISKLSLTVDLPNRRLVQDKNSKRHEIIPASQSGYRKGTRRSGDANVGRGHGQGCPQAPEAWHKFAFTYNDKQYTFSRLPQGLHNVPSICHHHFSSIWSTLKNRNQILSYMDDILMATTMKEENLEMLDAVADQIKKTGFLINLVKAQLVQPEVSYLGMTIGKEGKCPDTQHVNLICKLPVPQDISGLGRS
ncbi:unnamed protein product [Caretta caretta]